MQNATVENLFRAYFIDAEDIGSPNILKKIGTESGLNPASVEALLSSDLGAAEVAADELQARTQGVSGVPTFFVAGAPIASGAQKPELLASVLLGTPIS